jgi:uncharacterized protein
MSTLRRILLALMTAFIAVPLARAQSEAALAGMQAYNAGDYAAAYRLLRQAADAGDPHGLVNLGYLYARGHGVRADPLKSLHLYELSAKAGSSEGMNALGFKHLHATGIPKDVKRAVYWFCEAVVRGNWRAMNNLGLLLISGEVPLAPQEAINLWRQASELGHPNAMNNLAISYLNGPGRDLQKADEWMLRAAQLGHPGAQRYMRSRGYSGTFPPAINVELVMKPEPKGVVGHTSACGDARGADPAGPPPS